MWCTTYNTVTNNFHMKEGNQVSWQGIWVLLSAESSRGGGRGDKKSSSPRGRACPLALQAKGKGRKERARSWVGHALFRAWFIVRTLQGKSYCYDFGCRTEGGMFAVPEIRRSQQWEKGGTQTGSTCWDRALRDMIPKDRPLPGGGPPPPFPPVLHLGSVLLFPNSPFNT